MFKEIETSELVFKANIVATHLKDIGFYAEHEIVVNLLQQRAELLEALKRFTAYGKVFAYRTADGCPYDQVMEAIEKCDQ